VSEKPTPNIRDIIASSDHTPSSFEDYLSNFAPQVGDIINSYIPSASHPDIERYLYGPLREYSQNAGKRHRPLICFASCMAVGGTAEKATSAAAAVEHFHTAALIHDDIADEAELRRGKPCLHLTEGVGLAVNIGDLALSLVNGTVMKDDNLDDSTKVRVVTELIDMTRRTIEGQALDIGWARDGRYDITPEDYLVMATHKTAHYSGAVPLAIGAIIGGGTESEIEALRKYGLDTGLAFQIQDDLLNLIGNEEATKKDFRSDITEGKRTLVVVHALQNSPKRDRLIEILSSKEHDPRVLAEAVGIMHESGSISYARSYAENLTRAAKSRLVGEIAPSAARDLLISMADWFVHRLQ
jgi:geranylgeranyl diphosphate synthase type I